MWSLASIHLYVLAVRSLTAKGKFFTFKVGIRLLNLQFVAGTKSLCVSHRTIFSKIEVLFNAFTWVFTKNITASKCNNNK